MFTIHQVKKLQAQGYSVPDRKTAREYRRQTDFSPAVPVKWKRAAKIDAYHGNLRDGLGAKAFLCSLRCV